MILETAVERARVGCVLGVWQSPKTRWAHTPKEEQRLQAPAARLTRVRSAVSIHQGFLADESGQLPFIR